MDTMTFQELQGWQNYFKRRPVGWREDNRTAYVLESSGAKINRESLFPSLKMVKLGMGVVSDEPMQGFKSSMLFSRLITATGGDKLDFMKVTENAELPEV